jgi:cytochrome P450
MDLATSDDLFPLDPTASDVPGDGRRLRARGPLVPVKLVGDVRAWATGHRDVAEWIFRSRKFRRHPRHWADYTAGKVPQDWPLLRLITIESMLTMDGKDHRDLRSLVGRAFTPARVERMRSAVEETVADLIAGLDAAAPEETVDLRQRFAFQLPMRIICRLFGLDPSRSEELAAAYLALHDNGTPPEKLMAANATLTAIIDELIRQKRSRPGQDLTSALIAAAKDGEPALGDKLLHETLVLFLFAGHETTTNLLTNALKALDEHPAQLELVRRGAATMSDAVEETLRWASPIYTVMFYYAAEDVEMPVAGPGPKPVVRRGRRWWCSWRPPDGTRTRSARRPTPSTSREPVRCSTWPSGTACTTAWVRRSPGWWP